MKRLLLISPLSRKSLLGGDFFFRMPGFGLLKVAAVTPERWEVVIFDEKVEPLDLSCEADLVGITAMTSTVNRGYMIADHFKRRGIKVVMGGMHVSCLPEEALEHCDSVVIGEAEGLWEKVVCDFENNRLQRVYRHNNGLPELKSLPQPDWRLYDDKNYLPVHFVETTRGCPMDCEFCAVTNAFGGKYRNRPKTDVLEELQGLEPFSGFFTLKDMVFFVDDNIAGNRAYTKDLLRGIAPLGLKWFGQASINIADDEELLALCRDSGCKGLFIGFESLSPETLEVMGKKVNNPSRYIDAIRKIQDHGIGIDGSFVFGYDTDREDVFDRTVEFAIKARLEVAYFSILTPYPGTRLYRRLKGEGRITTDDWSKYDGNNVVFRSRPLSPERLQQGYYTALNDFYRYSSIFKRLRRTKSYKNFFYPMNFGFRRSVKRMIRAKSRLTSRHA
ncbi:MAG: B12-binding domain-containing radical SAM protein [Verrucomicrobia bacterium]|nr:B12-binding domain-containing radical SAM protein [Verrucomicrobiota bacterium]